MKKENNKEVNAVTRALGMIETRGLAAGVKAADAMVKAANVKLLSKRPSGGGLVAILIRGDVGAVTTAVAAGESEARKIGEVVSTRVIADLHSEVDCYLPGSAGK